MPQYENIFKKCFNLDITKKICVFLFAMAYIHSYSDVSNLVKY